MDCCKYVNVFQGCGEIDLPKPEGIAAKWFFIKAGCGNTSPGACLPFSAMSVAPFSGGYPTGYGDHCPNSHSRPLHFEQGKGLLGFAHLQQSGTGAIGYYYNYAVVTPKYANSPERVIPQNEEAQPGYYSAVLGDIKCELTVTPRLALHRYTFGSSGGSVEIDFDNNGLNITGKKRAPVTFVEVRAESGNTVTATAEIEGVKLYFAVCADSPLSVDSKKAVLNLKEGEHTAEITVSISLRSTQRALADLVGAPGFDCARKNAYDAWNKALSAIQIEAYDDKTAEIFYSNLYHSLIKPVDRGGESFIYDGDGAFMVDLNTLWDMYKTALPLILMLYRDTSEKIVETLLLVGEKLGRIPNSLGVSDEYKQPTEQARMLGAYVLLTAYRYGISVDVERMLSVITDDLFAENKRDFTVEGRCRSHTWMLDMADACANAADVARENGLMQVYEKLRPFAAQWVKAYSAETGLLDEISIYYEGTLYNYSFRQMVEMDRRIELAGGKERFAELLDRFFGFGAPDTVQPTDPFNSKPVEQGMKLGRFEGFNNESDTEAPFSYIYAGRHDRTCEIIRAGTKYMFTTGRGGIPGNNDSGALSSYYVLAALGIFPVAGQDLFLIGSPFVKSAKMSLSSGKTLEISVQAESADDIYVKSVKFNSRELADYRLPAHELMNGGRLEFVMSKTEVR